MKELHLYLLKTEEKRYWTHSKLEAITEGIRAKSGEVYQVTYRYVGSPRHLLCGLMNKTLTPTKSVVWTYTPDTQVVSLSVEQSND